MAGDIAIGLFSYGSGSVAEFFTGTVVTGYQSHLRHAAHRDAITRRTLIDYAPYRELREPTLPETGEQHTLPEETTGPYRLAALTGHKRIYQHQQAHRKDVR